MDVRRGNLDRTQVVANLRADDMESAYFTYQNATANFSERSGSERRLSQKSSKEKWNLSEDAAGWLVVRSYFGSTAKDHVPNQKNYNNEQVKRPPHGTRTRFALWNKYHRALRSNLNAGTTPNQKIYNNEQVKRPPHGTWTRFALWSKYVPVDNRGLVCTRIGYYEREGLKADEEGIEGPDDVRAPLKMVAEWTEDHA
ncbi:hypothetical protein C8R44DRAFT_858060 [Mycena epipterygia]|nr:hypothetical protein C8R44DRAFT_858060 [Mycena epipterygia]